jgi:ubiquinone/menaquinone biosynthesis C-methylase UbiE
MATFTTSGDDVNAEIRAAWTHGAGDYDKDAGHGLITPVVEDVWLQVLRDVVGESPLDVLDVGAGTGFLSVLAAKAGHRVTGVDLTPAMLEYARERAKTAGLRIDFREGDAMHLDFPDNQFDAVISRHVLWTMVEPQRAFTEWARVTKPGGEVIWFDNLQRPASPVNRARGIASRMAKRIRPAHDHAHSHHYDHDLVAHLPFRGLERTEPIRATLAELGATDVSCRALPRLERTERSVMELHKRIAPGSIRYVGRFTVTPSVKAAIGQSR